MARPPFGSEVERRLKQWQSSVFCGLKLWTHLRMEAFPKKKTQGSRGGFLKWWVSPHFTPQVLIILLGKPMGQLGKPTIVGNPHMLWYGNLRAPGLHPLSNQLQGNSHPYYGIKKPYDCPEKLWPTISWVDSHRCFALRKGCLLDSAELTGSASLTRTWRQCGHGSLVASLQWWLRGPIFFAHVCVRCVFFPKKKTGGKGTKYLESRWCCIFLVQLLLAGGLDSESEKRN